MMREQGPFLLLSMFLDEAVITVSGGNGGHGCVSWRREKYVAKGGPDGGNGGNGGNVYLQADSNTDTLSSFRSKKKFSAENGNPGSGKNKYGRDGEDRILNVPPGTIVNQHGNIIADLKKDGDQVLLARGGRGVYGNAHFASSTRQRPDFAEKGEPGETHTLSLELKLVADVGIIGFPSVGKSTLISVISSAKPKIAAYPFTTLVPNLGVVHVDDRSYVVCDIPGLIEGASKGKGLGDQFLKHIDRCGILLHVLDSSRALESGTLDASLLLRDYNTLRTELKQFSPSLEKKKELVVLSKADLVSEKQLEALREELEKSGIPIYMILSAATHKGTEELIKDLLPLVMEERKKREKEELEEGIPVLNPQKEKNHMGAFNVIVNEDHSITVTGKRIEQFTIMTDFQSEGSVLRFKNVIDRIGLKKAIQKERILDSVPVFIAGIDVGEYL